MLSVALLIRLIAHAMVALACGWLVLAGCRWIRSRSAVLGTIVGVAIVTRLAIGLALFWISYLELPIFRSLQLGGGFWQIALDATGYYQMAARAADAGRLFPLDHAVPSPFFVDVLAAWMIAVGVSPAAGMFLNLCLYVLFALIMTWCFAPVNDWRQDLPCIVGVTAYSFSPVIIFHSTQPLKDELSALLIVLAGIGVLALRRLGQNAHTTRDRWTLVGGTAAVTLATYGMGGIRWYFGFIVLCVLALTLAIFAVGGRSAPLRRYLAGSVIVLVAAWLAFWGSSGPYYQHVIGANLRSIVAWDPPRELTARELGRSSRAVVGRIAAIPSDLLNMTQRARTGFLMSGGATNIVVPLHKDGTAGLVQATRVIEAEHASAAYQELLVAERTKILTQQVASGAAATAPYDSTQIVGASEITPERADAARAIPAGVPDQLRTLAVGLAVVFIPLTVMKGIAGIHVSGGRGLLSIADLDTVFLDVSSLIVLTLLWQRRRVIANRKLFVVFGLILSVTTAVLLGYVVTNFGTLWRMRALVAVPLWVLVVALTPRTEGRLSPKDGESGAAPSTNLT
jgi:hypothetical protein